MNNPFLEEYQQHQQQQYSNPAEQTSRILINAGLTRDQYYSPSKAAHLVMNV